MPATPGAPALGRIDGGESPVARSGSFADAGMRYEVLAGDVQIGPC
jgi:hypothetical protein